MTPISKSAPLGGKRHFSTSRGTSAWDKAVSPALWRQPRTSQLYIGQSLASIATFVVSLGVRASLPSRAGGDWLSLGPERRDEASGSAPRRTQQENKSRLTGRERIAMSSPNTSNAA